MQGTACKDYLSRETFPVAFDLDKFMNLTHYTVFIPFLMYCIVAKIEIKGSTS